MSEFHEFDESNLFEMSQNRVKNTFWGSKMESKLGQNGVKMGSK